MHDASEKSGDLSRLGGDEFAVILSEISCPEDAADVAERILEALGRPVAIEGTAVSVSASAGIALFPQDASDADSLLRAADQALYHAKERGSSQCQLFQPGLNRTAQRRRAIRADLQTALDAEQIEIVYQPKVDLESGCTVGAEALARWSHPALGAVPPDEFVSVAERSGLATALGGYVVRRVCRDVRAFGYDGAGSIAINVGPDELASSEYFEQFSAALREHAVSPQTLQIEITERMLLRESLDIATNLRDLRGIGVSVYLDDFGTGRSSLADLCTHEVDGIKIDRSFICNVESDRVSASVVRALILLAQDAAIEVVAEGVENADQVGILRSMRCRLAQGYHLGKPMPADRFFERARREDSGAMPPVDDEIGGLA